MAATIAYFAFGFLVFGLIPQLRAEFGRYPAVYRPMEGIKAVMPMGIIAMFVAMFALAAIYALGWKGGSAPVQGVVFGALIGVFAVGSFVFHNYVNLNIGLKLTLQQAALYFIQWTLIGIVIALIYRPATR